MGTRQRRPFTPQDSPPQASSTASGEANDQHDIEEDTKQDRSASTRSVGGTPAALQAWTAHQSHAQATILFYVPRGTHTEDLAVTIGHDYVVAGVRGQEAIVKARLAGRIDPHTSRWQLERKRSSKRHRSHSKDRQRQRGQASSQSGESSSSSGAKSNEGAGARGVSAHTQEASSSTVRLDTARDPATDARSPRTPQQQSFSAMTLVPDTHSQNVETRSGETTDRAQSVETRSNGSHSYDVLGRSTDTLGSEGSQGSDDHRRPQSHTGSQDSQHDAVRQPHTATPPSLSQSMTLSDESGYVHSTSAGVRSLDSSMSAAEDTSRETESRSARSHGDDDAEVDPTVDARLVTLHLDKIDAGIWPCLVSGPAPSLPERLSAAPHLISQKSETSLSAALSEALSAHDRKDNRVKSTRSRSPSASSGSEAESDDRNAEASTLTVDTMGSDDSTTILGVRTSNEEDQYNMDPISLTLMGLQYASRSSGTLMSVSGVREGSRAFEYFRRAWRQGEVAVATKRLVDDYLPLPGAPHLSQDAAPMRNIYDTLRPRLVAALGGPTALARLYISYARLDLPSSAHRRPLLSLPITGQSTNPFGTNTPNKYTHYPTSPRSPGSGFDGSDFDEAHDPLECFEEAQRMDATVASNISDIEWREAREIHDVLVAAQHAFPRRNQRGARSPSSRSEGASDYDSASSYGLYASRYDDSTSPQHLRRQHRRKRRKGKTDLDSNTGTSSADQGVLFLVVSRAALLSVVVAGGMAVAGWWRRAAASGSG